ncbi:SMP-30/gluconolactonase/LRE family protein [Pyxidicoccus parkwayensis]|uniref:SMP-30/gluconolactonase/LRE family protein n=1 Tax=Pyxidicoccus parkwayensis TaxID=2813578 RepID=A0ABX7PAU3_9BACT|nr:L-dopachrome tautomerase-related protein [Pyxidicoccus parkwaysis]QSQ27638.1 SMP-30/gluconolactonase/LRE family protein [Pyxidicoccus parkwaysis]
MSRFKAVPFIRSVLLGALCLAGSGAIAQQPAAPSAAPATAGAEGVAAQSLKSVGSFDNLPVGIAVSKDGRTFLAFSRAIDPKNPYSVAELKDGKPQLYPPGLKQDEGSPAPDRLLAVQALTVDARNRLWILDSGKVGTNAILPGTPKLLAVDLGTNKVVRTVTFPSAIAGATAFLNDVVVDLSRGKEGMAFLTDASGEGPNGLVVVDLATGHATRRLNDHPSTKSDPDRVLNIHGQPLVQKQGPAIGEPVRLGSDGIALSADGRWVYYSPLTSHHLYRVSADALGDMKRGDADVVATVEDLGDKGFASDGLLGDAQGRIYLTDLENDAIHRRTPDGKTELVVKSPQLRWPDSMALEPDGTLVFTVTQIDLSPRFQGKDARVKPFQVYEVKTDSKPLMRGGTPPAQGRTPRH